MMIIAAKYTVKVYSGASFELTMTWRDEDEKVIELSTWTAKMSFYPNRTDRTLLKQVTTIGNVPNPSDSRIELSDTAPNIFAFIVDDETNVGDEPSFIETPGYYIFELSPDAETTDRLVEGRVRYEP